MPKPKHGRKGATHVVDLFTQIEGGKARGRRPEGEKKVTYSIMRDTLCWALARNGKPFGYHATISDLARSAFEHFVGKDEHENIKDFMAHITKERDIFVQQLTEIVKPLVEQKAQVATPEPAEVG